MLFLAKYPSVENIKDGMVSRIKAVDEVFESNNKVYLTVSYSKYWKTIHSHANDKTEVYYLNVLNSLFLIYKLFRSADIVYSHSIWGVSQLVFFLFLCKNKLYLDAHGVVPDEVRYYTGNKLFGAYLSLVEKSVFKISKGTICVTNEMISHFKKKYPKSNTNYCLFNIVPSNLDILPESELKAEKMKDDTINILYSGGVAKWQNIELMLDLINKAKNTSKIHFIFLVNNIEYVKNIIKENNYKMPIDITSVFPDQLKSYYAKADYAFILREDDIINRVANPTKLIEYLAYGIIPIVKSPNIGDFAKLGYEYVTIEQFLEGLPKPVQPSIHNVKIAKSILSVNNSTSLSHFVIGV